MSIAPATTGTEKVGTSTKQFSEVNSLAVNINGVAAALATQALDTFGATTDITDLDATTSKHGLFAKLDKVKLDGIEALAEVNPTDAEIATSYASEVAQISAGEITAGTSTAIRRYTPADIVALIAAHETAATVNEEQVLDWIGGAVATTDTIAFTYDDAGDAITADVKLKTTSLTSVQGELDSGSTGIFAKLGTGANVAAAGNDSRFLTSDQKAAIANSAAPAAGNPVQTLTAIQAYKLDDLATPDDTSDLDATTSRHGLMSKTDKEKIDGIEALAEVNLTDSEVATAYGNEVAQVLAGEITAGTESTLRTYAPDDIVAFIDQHIPAQASAGEITAGTETTLRHYAPDDIVSFIDQHIPAQVSSGEITAGTETGIRGHSPADIVSYIDQRNEYIKLSDVKANGTVGGTATAGSWQTRTINTEDNDSGGHCTSPSSNQWTLDAGTYRVWASAPAWKTDAHRIQLYNITDAETTILGVTAYADAGNTIHTHAHLSGQFTISGATVFELQHWTAVSTSTQDYGRAASFGDSEIYTTVEFIKVG